MDLPIIAYVQFVAQALPIIAILVARGRHPSVPYRRIALWCGILILMDVAALISIMRRGYNLDLPYVFLPIEVALSLWIMAAWQASNERARRFLLAIPVVLVLAFGIMLLLGPRHVFPRIVSPGLALVGLSGVLFTWVTRTLESRSQLQYEGWFWVCMGMCLFWMTFISTPIFGEIFLESRRSWVHAANLTRNWVNLAAFLMITWGVLCPRLRPLQPGFS